MGIYLTRIQKIIISLVVSALSLALVIGGGVAIVKAVKEKQQATCVHSYGSGVIKSEATCEKPGVIVYTCGKCDYELTEEIPANGHVQIIIEAVPAACTSKGTTDGIKCVTCDKVLVAPTETPILGHKVEVLKSVAATCTLAGTTEGSQCTRCKEILKAQTIIPAKGHTVVEVTGENPTCVTAGKTNGSSCLDCGKVFSAQETIPVLGHTDADEDGTCDICGDFDAMEYLKKFSQEGACTETAVNVGDTVAGKVFRFYRAESGLSQTHIVIDNNTAVPLGAMSKMIYGSVSDLPFYVGGEPKGADNIIVCYYEDYVDVYIAVGEYTIKSAEDTIVLSVTTSSKITAIGTTGTVKCLTLNE